MLHHWDLVRTDVSKECIAFIFRVNRFGGLATMLAVTGNRGSSLSHVVLPCSVRRLLVTANDVPSSQNLVTLMMEAIYPSETSVLTTAIRRNIPEDGILHSHGRENLKTYTALIG
jgi:hypothetical protein